MKLSNNFLLWKIPIFKQEVCREKWYFKEWSKFSQKHIKESLLKSNLEIDVSMLIQNTSYADIRNLFLETNFLQDIFYQQNKPIDFKWVFHCIEMKMKRQGFLKRNLNYLLFWKPKSRNFTLIKIYKKWKLF